VIRVGNELVLRVRVLGRSKIEGGRVGVLRTSERQVADLEPTSDSGDPQGFDEPSVEASDWSFGRRSVCSLGSVESSCPSGFSSSRKRSSTCHFGSPFSPSAMILVARILATLSYALRRFIPADV